ncbi:MAG: hypothetical protein QOH66_1567 [Actinomycetota bacterium]|nr:hypothetical protein [Actinomycetota bacterium]
MMDAGELLLLAAALASSPAPPGIVVEIGTYTGDSAVFMGRVLRLLGRDIPILSIDAFDWIQPDPRNPQGMYASYREKVRSHHLERNCMVLSAFSDAAAAIVPDRIGLLIVDGGHAYEVARKDLLLYSPKVLPMGYLFVDDYGPAYPEVVRAVNEFLEHHPEFTAVHRSHFLIAQRMPSEGKSAIE